MAQSTPIYPTPGSSASIPAYTLPSSPILNPLGRNKEPYSRTWLSHCPRIMGENSDQRRNWTWDLRLWSPLTHTAAWEFSTAGGPHWASSKPPPFPPFVFLPPPLPLPNLSPLGTHRVREEAVWRQQGLWRLLGTGYPSPSLWDGRQRSHRAHPTPLVPGSAWACLASLHSCHSTAPGRLAGVRRRYLRGAWRNGGKRGWESQWA